MKKRIIEWKSYINESKKNLCEIKKTMPYDIYYVNKNKISNKELNMITETVKAIATSDEFTYNPIGKLINKNIYNHLNEEDKMRYVLELSKVYLALKAKIYKNFDMF